MGVCSPGYSSNAVGEDNNGGDGELHVEGWRCDERCLWDKCDVLIVFDLGCLRDVDC